MRRRIAGSSHTRVCAMSPIAFDGVAPIPNMPILPYAHLHSIHPRPAQSFGHSRYAAGAVCTRLAIAPLVSSRRVEGGGLSLAE